MKKLRVVRLEKNPAPQPSTLNPQLYLQPPTLDGQSKSFTVRHSLLAIRCRFTSRYLLLTIRYLLLTIRYSPIASRCRFGSAGASPSHFSRPSSQAPRLVLNRRSCFPVINYGLKSVLGASVQACKGMRVLSAKPYSMPLASASGW
jgi:hypothetical protein